MSRNRIIRTIKLSVLRVEEYAGMPSFVVDYVGKEIHVPKLPGQPDDLKVLTCEIYKVKTGETTKSHLRQYVENHKEPRHFRSPESLATQMYGEDMHRYGNTGRCNLCGHAFGFKKGWKYDTKDIFLCDECRKKIKAMTTPKKSNNKEFVRIISTPMGNKMR